MASDLFLFDNMSFFSDQFSPLSDSSIDPQHDFFQNLEDNLNSNNNGTTTSTIQETSADETANCLDQIAAILLSSSPPSQQLENLSICQAPHNNFPNATCNSEYSGLEVKTEEYQVPFETITGFNYVPQNCGNNAAENVGKLMQRSHSSNSFDRKPNFLFQPRFDSLLEAPNLLSQVMTPPENNFSTGQMRRVCSTGDLQVNTIPNKNILSSSPLSTEGSFLEEPNAKVGRYTAEERKERILRYRTKRTQRNFNKTIKYACRKTLADSRPRIRGRFARNDEAVEIPKASMFNTRYEDEDDLWIEGFHEEDEEGSSAGKSSGTFYNNFGSAQYQYYSY